MLGDLLDPVHLILLLVVALLVFGPKRLPEVGKGLGETLREFRKAMQVQPQAPVQDAKTVLETAMIESPPGSPRSNEEAEATPDLDQSPLSEAVLGSIVCNPDGGKGLDYGSTGT